MVDTVEVDVKGAAASKINWTQVASAALTLGTVFGLNVSDEAKVSILAVVGTVGPAVTTVLRTWFTTKLTAASAAKV